ncbi:MAG: ankyrin repeat domain-containing protein, partial [Thioalkalivibrio sp.]|nr:ankyrin repeat domain-containing protein [Thioalkalivibrio sp.]
GVGPTVGRDVQGRQAQMTRTVFWRTLVTGLMLVALLPAESLASAMADNLLHAVRKGDAARVEDLLQRGADPDAISREAPYEGKTALMWAADLGHERAAESLLRHGAQVDIRHPKGSTALMYAVLRDQPDTVERLLRAGADPNILVRHGWTPVLLATVKNQPGNLRVLSRYGANFGVQDLYGWTPLMRASERGDPGLVKVLLELGCNPDQRESTGLTALDIAEALGHGNVVWVLRAASPDR